MQAAPQYIDANNLAILRRGSAEWDVAWNQLRAAYGDTVAENSRSGEVWQYMGTWRHDGRWFHEFRHRDLPGPRRWGAPRGPRQYFNALASPDWTPARAEVTA